MTHNRQQVIFELVSITEKCIAHASELKNLPVAALNFRTHEKEWSVLECLEHLNRYGDFYLPEIGNRIQGIRPSPEATSFKSGWVGGYFADLMRANNGKVKKMQSPKGMNPLDSQLSPLTIDRFIKQLNALLSILRQCEDLDLTRIRCSISLVSWIKLRLGDTLRFYTFHIERHVLQANRMAERWSAANEFSKQAVA